MTRVRCWKNQPDIVAINTWRNCQKNKLLNLLAGPNNERNRTRIPPPAGILETSPLSWGEVFLGSGPHYSYTLSRPLAWSRPHPARRSLEILVIFTILIETQKLREEKSNITVNKSSHRKLKELVLNLDP